MLRSLLFITLIIISTVNGTTCKGTNATTYLRSSSTRLMEFAIHTIKDVSLNGCADACTQEIKGHRCSSFEYDSLTRECSLHEENGQPIGPSVLAKASEPTLSFFQQICIDEEYICPSPYTFERHPQSMLVGLAMTVIRSNSLSECLSNCLKEQSLLSSACSSVMYFYETGECILNRATKDNYSHLFKTEIQDQLVDYFENICIDVSCSSIHWLRSEDYQLSSEKDVIIESMSSDECKALCSANVIGEDKFPCHSFVYTSSKEECHLSADINSFSIKSTKSSNNFNLNPISNGEYYQKICLNSSVRCIETSYELIKNHKIEHSPYKILKTVSVHHCLSICIDEGANCASITYDYNTDSCHFSEFSQFSKPDAFVVDVNSDYFDKICDSIPIPQEEKKIPSPPSSTPPPDFANNILVEPPPRPSETNDKTNKAVVANAALNKKFREEATLHEITNENNDGLNEKVSQVEAVAEETVIDDDGEFNQQMSNSTKGKLVTECRMSGISVTVEFLQPTTGTIFIKDHFSTCRAEFQNSSHSVLHIPYPDSNENEPRCPGIELAPSLWSFMVVIQQNDMESPLLLTSTDRVFNITCDYTELVEKTQNNLGIRSEYDERRENVKEDFHSEKIKMEILRNGNPVTIVPLGEIVELHWTVMNPEEGLGFFINECVAERVGGAEPSPEPLKIIHQGCPEEKVRNRLLDSIIESHPEQSYSTRLKVFRFDGSRRVRIKCTIDVCIDRCQPVVCDGLTHQSGESYGRKKRQSMKDLQQLLSRIRPDFRLHNQQKPSETEMQKENVDVVLKRTDSRRLVMGTLTVLDPDDSSASSDFKHETIVSKKSKPKPEFYTSNLSVSEERMCFLRWQIAAAIGFTAILLIITIFISTYIIHIKCIRSTDYGSVCSSSMSGTTYSSEYTTASHGYQSPYVPSSSHNPNSQDHTRTYCIPQAVR